MFVLYLHCLTKWENYLQKEMNAIHFDYLEIIFLHFPINWFVWSRITECIRYKFMKIMRTNPNLWPQTSLSSREPQKDRRIQEQPKMISYSSCHLMTIYYVSNVCSVLLNPFNNFWGPKGLSNLPKLKAQSRQSLGIRYIGAQCICSFFFFFLEWTMLLYPCSLWVVLVVSSRRYRIHH